MFKHSKKQNVGQIGYILIGLVGLMLQCDPSSEYQDEKCLLDDYTKDTCPASTEALPLLKKLYDDGTFREVAKVLSGPVFKKPNDARGAPPKCCYYGKCIHGVNGVVVTG